MGVCSLYGFMAFRGYYWAGLMEPLIAIGIHSKSELTTLYVIFIFICIKSFIYVMSMYMICSVLVLLNLELCW